VGIFAMIDCQCKCHLTNEYKKKFLMFSMQFIKLKSHLHFQSFLSKMPITATVTAVALASLGNEKLVETTLFVLHYPRKAREIKPLLLLQAFWQ
jgi:hypothetical protein